MITDREIADKRNDVTMLRLQINEHKERRRLDEIEQSELDDVLPSRNELVDRLESVFALNRQQEDTICTYMDAVASQNKVLKDFQDEINEKDTIIDESKTMINRLYDTYDSMYSTMLHMNHGLEVDLKVCGQDVERIEAELSNAKSAIVMKNGVINEKNKTIDELTETTRKLKGRLSSMYAANSDQDTTINKLNALLADEKITLAAYRNNPLSDQVADRDNRIEQLIVLNDALRTDVDGRDRHIEELENRVNGLPNNFFDVVGQLRDTNRRQTITIDELNDMYCDVCGKLEQIEKVTKDAISYVHIDEIIKIIQEE